ncbi:hypothetical protein SLEP1_g9376 [Rubroshorea leprosula]|uniref:Mitochondrial import inner membrane translocase subunit Tim21 n=1 Tax=Rubroshorea leprosula TaxID=152421 RepID=A0AAV5IFQ0_9ROSI|nr:hypothetical protein SLEP1_g9376 [Rubroshorea leprosula]
MVTGYNSHNSCKLCSLQAKKEVFTIEDPFDSPTYHIPEKPVTFTEGAGYSVVILAGLGIAAAAGYAVFKELIFEPKEYKIFNKALKRIQDDSQVRVRLGHPITGYGQESRNRAACQRIPNRAYMDEDGVEHVEIEPLLKHHEILSHLVAIPLTQGMCKYRSVIYMSFLPEQVNFYIRGPHGFGKVFASMFKDQTDKQWKYTYLIVQITSPSRVELMLESYLPAYKPTSS